MCLINVMICNIVEGRKGVGERERVDAGHNHEDSLEKRGWLTWMGRRGVRGRGISALPI